LFEGIKNAHEGKIQDSKGWQYQWDEKNAKKVLLRTHTTCISDSNTEENRRLKRISSKILCTRKMLRNETVDWSMDLNLIRQKDCCG